jgi:hypothetical protein
MDYVKEEAWIDFCYQFIETGSVDYDRAKTIAAMKTLCERVPQEDLDKLPGSLIVFAPSTDKLGEVFPLRMPVSEEEACGVIIYLSPELESKSQEEVDRTVAHEFAHVVLGCYRSDYTRKRSQGVDFETQGDVPSEQDADALIGRWGYEPAYKSNRKI